MSGGLFAGSIPSTFRRVVFLALAIGAASCGSAGDEPALDVVSSEAAAEVATNEAQAEAAVEAVAPSETLGDIPPAEASGDDAVDLPYEPGSLFSPCQQSSDCFSGYCIETADGRICTSLCLEECPEGWDCWQDLGSGPDIVFVCVPRYARLCFPCQSSEDCEVSGLAGGIGCVKFGEAGAFCGGNCEHWDCPSGYLCQEVETIEGTSSKQCVPEAGECVCPKVAIEHASTTACSVTNEAGTCKGWRKCAPEGLTACDAAVPAHEKCDGLDNDCDGEEDEELGSTTCGFGECQHTIQNCLEGQSQPCDAFQGAVPEGCDGKDNDCDGEKDEGYPDSDTDGIPDCLETDKDGDGIPDFEDNCDGKYNPDQADFDLDTLGNACDPDDDNDLVADVGDCAPLAPEAFPGAFEQCNGADDDCDILVDEGYQDSDADKLADCVDDDDDNDGTTDDLDCAPADPLVHPGLLEACDGKDNDCSGAADDGFVDSDQDGLADCVDPDADDDGIVNPADNCPAIPNPGQDDLDQDDVGDLCDVDADGDSIPDPGDNCPGLKNTLQLDSDKDGFGDDCDEDKDGDSIPNDDDNCPLVSNPLQSDSDKDGIGDLCENDLDGDGAPDSLDCQPMNPGIFPGAAESCDGVDNDCDGSVDQGFPDSDFDGLKDCIDADDDNDGDPDDADCQPKNPAVHGGAKEICNGINDDCDADTDEDTGLLACGKGECFHTIPACIGGIGQLCDPYQGAALEKCDAADNDCDGLTDEDLGTTSCGKGVCLHSLPLCLAGKLQLCDPMLGADKEICDGLDNDCNGKTDDGLGTLSCGKGVCAHTVPACLGGVEQLCDPMQGAAGETCDGIDNDCDGAADEELGSVTCGKGECLHTVEYCVAGKIQFCWPFEGASDEVCDGLDNDCDAAVDEGLGTTTCGLGPCKQTVANCLGGQPQLCKPLPAGGPETCDGLDNDCDGGIDEDLGTWTCGLGPCLHTVLNCANGQPQTCDPKQGAAEEECNGIDDDCDGPADEGLGSTSCGVGICEHEQPNCVGGAPKSCDPMQGKQVESCNGLDDDCDGADDNDLPPAPCGKGACLHDVVACVDGKPGPCDPLLGQKPETCDGKDQDCDGVVDNGLTAYCCIIDGVKGGGEECDDGNPVGDDGCSNVCTLPGCRGLAFDGKDDKVVLLPDPTLETPNAFTWELWVYFSGHRDGDAQSIIANYGQDGYGCGLQAYDYPGANFHTFEIACGHGYSWHPWAWTSMKYVPLTWYHLAMTYNGSAVTLFVNGEQQFSAAGAVILSPTQPLLIGARNSGGDPNWTWGIIDDVRIWNHARTKEQIQGAMKKTLAGNEAGLLAYYRMDQQSGGQQALDYTGKGHAGTLGNSLGADSQDPVWSKAASPIAGCAP
jgi:hypothetical protein